MLSPSPPPDFRPRARPDVVFRRVGEDWLLFDPRSGEIHVLNLSAALVWSFCTGEHPVERIATEVAEAYPEGVEGEPVAEALAQFRDAGLLEP